MRGYCFEIIYHRNNLMLIKKEIPHLNYGNLLVVLGSLQIKRMFKSILCKTRIMSVEFLSALLSVAFELQREGVQLYRGPRATALLNVTETKPFHLGYSSLACIIGIVGDVCAVIDHIWGIVHYLYICMVTNSEVSEKFAHQVDNGVVLHNVSTSFCDGAHFELVVFLLEIEYNNPLVYILL